MNRRRRLCAGAFGGARDGIQATLRLGGCHVKTSIGFVRTVIHHEHHVFQRHHRHQRPEDQRDNPEHVGRGRDRVAGGAERDRQRCRAGSVPISPKTDAQRSQREEPDVARMVQPRRGADRRQSGGCGAADWTHPQAYLLRSGPAGSFKIWASAPHDQLRAVSPPFLRHGLPGTCAGDRLFPPRS